MSESRETQEPATPAILTEVPDRSEARQRVPWRARGLAGAGALLFAIAAWSPWVVASATNAAAADKLARFALYLDPAVIATPPLDAVFGRQDTLFFWSGLTVLGILLQPLLWQDGGWARRAGLALFALWLAAAIGVSAVCAVTLAQVLGSNLSVGGIEHHLRLLPTEQLFAVRDGQLGVGLPLAAGALALAVWGWIALLVATRRGREGQPTATLQTTLRRHIPGAGMLTVGVLLWEAGSLTFPWATVNCTAVPLFFGSCTGLPFSGVVGYGVRATIPFLDTLVALHAVSLLLAGGALLLLVGVWGRAGSRMLAGWAVAWTAAASFFVFLAAAGIQLVNSQAAALGLPRGSWSGDSGIFVALLGLFFALAGAVWLWVGALRSSRA